MTHACPTGLPVWISWGSVHGVLFHCWNAWGRSAAEASWGLRMLPSLSAHQLLSSIVGQAIAPLSWRRAQHNYMFEMYFWLEKVILIGGISMLPKASMEQWCVKSGPPPF